MDGRRLELVSSLDLQGTVDKVLDDTMLDFAQYSLLREAADAKLYHLLSKVCGEGAQVTGLSQQGAEDLRKLQDACVRVAHLLQSSCLALRRLELSYQDRRLACEALQGQLAYMQACLRRSLASFDSLA